MSIKSKVTTDGAPNAMPNLFSQAIKANGMVFCSGSVGMTPDGKLVEGTIQDRVHQILKNLSAVLEAAGSRLGNVVKVNIFLADMADFGRMNEVYVQYNWGETMPSRTCVAAKQLPLGTDVEMECIAMLDPQPKL